MGLSELFEIFGKSSPIYTLKDIFALSRQVKSDQKSSFEVLIDTSDCAARLYGGFHNDWMCGGQWNTAYTFLNNLVKACEKNDVVLTFLFIGGIYNERKVEWTHLELQRQFDSECIIKSMEDDCAFPNNANWVAPSGYHSCLLLMLRKIGESSAACRVLTVDATSDVVSCIQNFKYDAVLSRNSELLIMQPPNLFDSSSLLLTRNLSSFSAKQINYELLLSELKLQKQHLHLFASLLGTHKFLGDKLAQFHDELLRDKSKNKLSGRARLRKLIPAIVNFIDGAEFDLNDSELLANAVLGCESEPNVRTEFIACVKHYQSLVGASTNNPDQELKTETVDSEVAQNPSKEEEARRIRLLLKNASCPDDVSSEVWKIVTERYCRGLMSPQIMSILKYRSMWLTAIGIDNQRNTELPSGTVLFQSLRQKIYAVLLEVRDSNSSDISVTEWVSGKNVDPEVPVKVSPAGLPWLVPSLHDLWTMTAAEADSTRLRAFLSCMNSDLDCMRKLPPQFLFLCCVLRYIVSYSNPACFMTSTELDAFLLQAIELSNWGPDQLGAIHVERLSTRAMELASIFMQGCHYAVIANDACGQPIPLKYCAFWTFFDGKLFQMMLSHAHYGSTRKEMCKHQEEKVLKLETMSKAITASLNVQFMSYRQTLGLYGSVIHASSPASNIPHNNHGPHPQRSARRGSANYSRGKQAVSARGGRMDIAGVTVGFWGANIKGEGYGAPPQIHNTGPFAAGYDPRNPLAKPEMPPPRIFSGGNRGGYGDQRFRRSYGDSYRGKPRTPGRSFYIPPDAPKPVGRGRGMTCEADDSTKMPVQGQS